MNSRSGSQPRRFLTAEWRHLLMLNYEVDAALLQPHVPRGTELDTHAGRIYASVVAFQFRHTRVLGIPIPFHRNFEELNLRFYVRRIVQNTPRRAVVFIREVVPRAAIALVARMMYNEPYVSLPMRSTVAGDPPVVCYEWRLGGRWHRVQGRAAGDGALPASGSHEEFIAEHAWGYTRQRNGSTIEYAVKHEPWVLWPASDVTVDADLERLYGSAIGRALVRPSSAFVATGSPVTVYQPTRVGA